MTIKIYKNDQLINSIRRYKKSQIFQYIDLIPFEESALNVFLRVDYGIGRNESYHISKDALLKALSSYTEKSLIDFIGSIGALNKEHNG